LLSLSETRKILIRSSHKQITADRVADVVIFFFKKRKQAGLLQHAVIK